MATKQFDAYSDLITFTRASTATYLDSDGLLKSAATNTPRIEYDANGNRLGLLIEEARTNLLLRSEALTVSPWSANPNTTLTANDKVSPDGSQTGTKVVATTSSNNGVIQTINTGSTIASKSFTLSVWVYADTTFNFTLRSRGTGTTQEGQNTTVSTVAGQWVRVSSTHTFTAAADGNDILIALYTAVFNVANTNTVWFWGAQLEAGSFPTSYIPTAGATATRAADVASIPTSAFGYNQKAGTVVCEISRPHLSTAYAQIASLDDTTLVNRVSLSLNGGSGRRFRVEVFNNSVSQFANNAVANGTGFPMSVALSYALNDFAAVADGGTLATGASGTVPTVNQLVLGNRGGSDAFFNGHLKSLQFYPRRLTNAQLQELTA
jgi:hypothetical protein